jgi:hypothetical protein|tara:strand:+ start:1707 stop:2222 length:516 start_codon:yes stop_codon:yes gene_type:complete
MCGRKPRPDPRIAEQQAQQRADVEAAKQAERDKVAKEKASALEESKAEAARIADVEAAATRQTETEKVVEAPKTNAADFMLSFAKPTDASLSKMAKANNLGAATTASPETPEVIEEAVPVKSTAQEREKRVAKFGQTATAGRRRKRSGSRGRRSLITGLGGGIGYFNRFGG